MLAGSYVSIDKSIFRQTYSKISGGAIFITGNYVNITDSLFDNCNVSHDSPQTGKTYQNGGGAIYILGDNVNIVTSNFTDANGREGGAVYIQGKNATIDGVVIQSSYSSVRGGAIFIEGQYASIKNSFVNNTYVKSPSGFTNTNLGGAIFIKGDNANISYSNFELSVAGSGGAIYSVGSHSTVYKSNFTNNLAHFDGGAIYWQGESSSVVSKYNTVDGCTFTGNTAYAKNPASQNTEGGGAIYWSEKGQYGVVKNSNFTNNIASNGRYSGDGGAVYINGNATVVNCDFIGNEASRGPAIYFWNLHESKHVRSISHSTFLNNKANMDSIAPFTLTVNGTNIEIAFHGNNNLFNAILSRLKGDVNVTNVTYWGASGIENTGDSTIVPVMLYTQAGQNATVRGVVDGVEVNITRSTDAEGKIVFENVREYNITVSHDEDSYYFSGKTFFTSRQLSLNMTDITTNDFTVNITAKSDIFEEYMSGEMIFRVDGQEFYASYAGNGTWWAMHTFDDFGTYKVSALFNGPYNVIVRNGTIVVNKIKTEITGSAITATYNVNKYLVITLKDGTGKALSGVKVTVNLNGAKTYTTDSNGQIKVSTKGLAPKAYTAKVAFNGDAVYDKSAKDIKVTVKKATPKLTAKKKTFKRSVKVKKYSIVLKNNVGKAIKKAKVTIKIGKKTFKAKTNSKGKATFKIKKLAKKGNYKAKVSYKGSKYYNKVTKKVKIRIK